MGAAMSVVEACWEHHDTDGGEWALADRSKRPFFD
jgi:hypothetical protein